MPNKKQTATKLLKERLLRIQSNYKEGSEGHNCFGIASNLCDEYEQDFKEQIQIAFEQGMIKESSSSRYISDLEAEKYYNETFKND